MKIKYIALSYYVKNVESFINSYFILAFRYKKMYDRLGRVHHTLILKQISSQKVKY